MKKLYTFLSVLCVALSASAQQPANAGFENWTSQTLYYDCPPYLTTAFQSYFTLGTGNVYPVSSPVQGVQAAHLETVSNGVDTIYGGMFYGIPSSNNFNGGGPYNERPDSMAFWTNYDLMAGDTATVVVALEAMNANMGFAYALLSGNSGGWVRVTAPFQYFSMANPDSISAIIANSSIFSGATGIPGSWMEIDSITMIGAVFQLPNPNFETWNAQVVNEPDNWTTLNFANIYNGNYSVTQDNTPYTGSYDCLIETTVSMWGDTIGYITNGNFNGPNGPGGGMQVNQNPQKITGYYKYYPTVSSDTALAGAWDYHWDFVGDSAVPLDQNVIQLPAANNWTYFEINLTYNAWPPVDTLNISFTSSNFNGNYALMGLGSQLYLDELGVSYYPLGMEEGETSAVTVFPNPTTRFINVRLEDVAAGENTFNVYDAQGKLVKSALIQNAGSGFYTMEVSELPAGTYTWELVNADGKTSSLFVKE